MSFYIEVCYPVEKTAGWGQKAEKVAGPWEDVVSSSSHLEKVIHDGALNGKRLHSLRLSNGDVLEFTTRKWSRKRPGA